MGTAFSSPFHPLLSSRSAQQQSPFPSRLLNSLATRNAARSAHGSPSKKDASNVGTRDASDVDDAFEAAVYRSQMSKVSLALRMEQARARLSSGDDDAAALEAQAQQLSFSFYAESRVEELAVFRQRTAAVADQLEGAQRESFASASQRVSMRFSMSLEISGAALNGFAGAAEGLADEPEDTFDGFLQFAEDALAQVNEIMNQIFELLDGFFSGDGDFATRFNQLLEGLQGITFPDFQGLLGSPEGGDAAAAEFQSTQFSFQMEFEFAIEYTSEVQSSDPITLDLDGDGIELTGYTNGAQFDIEGSGSPVHTAFVTGGDAFLALDRNGNGLIDSGKELFGDQHGAANGFEELRKFDSNRDGVIDRNDRDFDKLVLFKDNGNGTTEEGELISIADAGVSAIDLGYRNVDQAAAGGNRIAQIASFLRQDGTRGQAVDALLNFLA